MKKVSPMGMIALMAFYSVVANLVHPIEPTIYTNLAFHDYMFGVAFACMSVTNFAFSPFWGSVCDRFGSSRMMGYSCFGYAACQYLFGICTTEFTMSVARLLAGIFISTISVGQLIYVMRYSQQEKTTQNLMYLATASAVFSPVGYLIGGFLGDRTIFGTVLAQVFGLVLLGVFLLVFLKDEIPEEQKTDRAQLLKNVNPLKSFGEIRPYLNSFLIVFFLIALLTMFATTCYEQSFNYLIKAEFGFPASYNGMLKALVGIVALVSNFTLCNWLLHHTDSRKSTIWVLALQMVLSVGVAMITDLGPFIVLNVVFFGLNAVYLPLLQATMNGAADKENSGVFAGMFNAMRSIGNIGGSLVAGFIYAVNCRAPFVLTAILYTICVVFAIMNYKQSKKGLSQNSFSQKSA